LQNYQKGMAAFDNCHSPTVRTQWVALKDEIGELVREPNSIEIWDIVHAGGRLIYKLMIQLETIDRARLIVQLDRSELLARFDPNNQTES
jgi:hypothetical protein